MSHLLLFCGPRPCPTPKPSRRLRNTLWACPYCAGVWRLKHADAFGYRIWYWSKTELVAR